MKPIISIIFSFLSVIAYSQDYGKEIKRIYTEFSQLKSYHIKAKISTQGDEAYAFTASVMSSKYGTYSKVGQNEMLINDKYSIAVDHSEKTIKVSKGDNRLKMEDEDLGLEAIDELINENTNVKYLGETEKYKTYVIYNNEEDQKTTIKISKTTGFFYEIEVFYDEKDEVSISSYKVKYTLFKKNPEFKKSDFDESQIIMKNTKGQIVPISKYTNYQLVIEE